MTLPLWGQLQMSLDDPRTISEFIADEIASHEADPEAHLGAGESLSVHKNQNIVDHPQGSVLADKWSHSELDFATTFENLTPFVRVGSVAQEWPGVIVESTGLGIANRGEIGVNGDTAGLPFNTAKDMLFQVSFFYEAASTEPFIFSLGPYNFANRALPTAMGWTIFNNKLKFHAANANGSIITQSAEITLTQNRTYIIRIFNNSLSNEIECYIDGVRVATLTWPVADYSGTADVRILGYSPTTRLFILRVLSLYFSVRP